MTKVSFVTLSMVLAPFCAFAVDGVVLINQSTVTAAGGFPYTITQAGSYRLSGNLTVPNVNTDGIVISVDNVTIDLNGFSIIGPAVCAGCPAKCTSTGTGVGIKAGDTNFLSSAGPVKNGFRSIAVMNGTIRGMGSIGLIVGSSARIENVRVLSSGDTGIVAHSGSTITGNVSNGNGNQGMFIGAGSVVWGNTALGNNVVGLLIFGPSIVNTNAAAGNGFDLVQGGPGLITSVANATGSMSGGDCGLP